MDIKLHGKNKNKVASISNVNNFIILSLISVFSAYYFFKPSSIVLSFVLSLVILKIFVMYAFKLGFIDTINSRSTHIRTTPTSAGIAFLLAVVLSSFFSDLSIYSEYTFSILATISIFILGIADDLKNIRARYKILVISAATLLICTDGLVISDIGSFWGYSASLYYLALPITIFAVVGLTNSLNLIDGLDGLAASISIIILASLWYIGFQNTDLLIMGVSSLFISALMAFLFFNWNPARVFMGDSGSLTLGFVISILSIRALEYVNPMVVIFLVALPVIDTIVIITRRKQYGKPLFSPDRNHLHHVMLDIFNEDVRKTVIFLAITQVFYVLFGLFIISLISQEFALLLFIANVVMWYVYLTSRCHKHLKLIKTR